MDLMVYNTGGVQVPRMQIFSYVSIASALLFEIQPLKMEFLQLQDASGTVIAFFHPTRPTRYQIGDVYGELHFVRTAGAGTVVSCITRS